MPPRRTPSPRPTARARASEPGTFRVADLRQVRLLAHPLRLRLLEAFAQPRTTKQVAELLGEKPTRLYHHVDALAAAGLLTLEHTRAKRGTTEKYFRTVAHRIEVDPDVFGGSVAAVSARMAQAVLGTARRELAARGGQLDEQFSGIPVIGRAVVALTIEQARALHEELMRLLERYRDARAPAPSAGPRSRWVMTVAFHPAAGDAAPARGRKPGTARPRAGGAAPARR